MRKSHDTLKNKYNPSFESPNEDDDIIYVGTKKASPNKR
jgi:hypothetical protein